jgi:hypothetical protein
MNLANKVEKAFTYSHKKHVEEIESNSNKLNPQQISNLAKNIRLKSSGTVGGGSMLQILKLWGSFK